MNINRPIVALSLALALLTACQIGAGDRNDAPATATGIPTRAVADGERALTSSALNSPTTAPTMGSLPPTGAARSTPTTLTDLDTPTSRPTAASTQTATPSTRPTGLPTTGRRPTAVPTGAPLGGESARITLVGSLKLEPFNKQDHGDVAGYKDLAFVGKYQQPCVGTGVDIIDISNPAAPAKIADTDDHTGTSMEDMQAMRIRDRDVLAIGLQACGHRSDLGADGLELVDITDPRRPQRLSLFDTTMGVHEFDLTATPGGRVLALLAVPGLEPQTANQATGSGGKGDLLILDITDPAKPVQIAEWGVLDEPSLGRDAFDRVKQGEFPDTFLHSVRAGQDGTRAYLSYWDAGVIMLDIADPAKPRLLGRTTFSLGEEGNAHSTAEVPGANLLVQADEDFAPFDLALTSNAFTGRRTPLEVNFTDPLVGQPGRQMAGEVVDAGRGCPAGARGAPENGDQYLADPRGKIALVEAGTCPLDQKLARAQEAGATGAIFYGDVAGGRPIVDEKPVALPDGARVTLSIPAVFVDSQIGSLLRNGRKPVTARAAAEFNGWGFLRFFDISDPARPVQLGKFATRNTTYEAVAERGLWSAHNPELLRDGVLLVSWYSDGIRMLDISGPSTPREIASWTGAGRPGEAPPVTIWSVVPHGDLLLASDMNYGLYILRAGP